MKKTFIFAMAMLMAASTIKTYANGWYFGFTGYRSYDVYPVRQQIVVVQQYPMPIQYVQIQEYIPVYYSPPLPPLFRVFYPPKRDICTSWFPMYAAHPPRPPSPPPPVHPPRPPKPPTPPHPRR